MSRLEKLEAMFRDDPADNFVRYGLAMEYRSLKRFDEALELFRELAKDTPPHVPSFFMMGQMLAEMEQVDNAKASLLAGIEAGKAQGDMHAVGEMTEFLNSLE